jgi:DNA-binding MarR family transcriptional regulator
MQPLPDASDGRLKPRRADCAAEVFEAVPPVIWYLRRQMRAQRKGLSIPQFRALYLIQAQPAANLSAVAEHLGISLPATSRLIGGLQTRGLVQRRDRKDDRRQLELAITARGAGVLSAARAATLASMREELSGLDNVQRELVVRAMRLLRGVFEPVRAAAGARKRTGVAAKPAQGGKNC